MNAGVPGAHCSPGEVRQSSDARLPLRYEGDVDPLKYCTNGDHGQTGVPDGEQALDAASLLACEIGKSIAGQPCRLPQRMQSLTRQGVSIQFPGVNTYLDRGLTGLNEVDQLVVQLNPHRLVQSPKVYSMDQSPNRITTWP